MELLLLPADSKIRGFFISTFEDLDDIWAFSSEEGFAAGFDSFRFGFALRILLL